MQKVYIGHLRWLQDHYNAEVVTFTADLGQGGGVVAQRPGEGASACVGEADVDHEPALGHARRVAGAGERQVNGRWWPGRRAV